MTPEEAALAAEYALGLLQGAERAQFEAAMRQNPALLGEVHDWQEYFASLTAEVAQRPPARVKRRLLRRMFGARMGALRFWQGLSAVGLAATLGLASVFVFDLPIGPEPAPVPAPVPASQPISLIASEMTAAGEDLRFLAIHDGQALHLRHTAGAAPPGRDLELWLIAGDAPPLSIAVLSDPSDIPNVTLPDPLPEGDLVLAVTDEPLGGAPEGVATGQVRALGTLVPIWQVWR